MSDYSSAPPPGPQELSRIQARPEIPVSGLVRSLLPGPISHLIPALKSFASPRGGASSKEVSPREGNPGQAGKSPAALKRGWKICVLEPDPEVAEDLSRLFLSMGAKVLALSEVIGASNRIREFGPDLLVLEVLMPSLAGPKLVEILRRNLDRFPALILFSRLDLVTLSQVARITAADDYIVKDGGYLNLVNRVRYHLETRNEQ